MWLILAALAVGTLLVVVWTDTRIDDLVLGFVAMPIVIVALASKLPRDRKSGDER